ncbi:MAG: Inward rectifier potassium channel Irk [Flavobacterium sp.]|nr:MAG: Inward rectifier potassium channel Irk [Flavobacterium sp.]
MDLLKKINTKAQAETNTGFGTSRSNYGGRFINKDGTANISKRGLNIFTRISWYHTMLNMPRWKFLIIILSFYALVNFVFASLYYSIGIQYLDGIENTGSEWLKFWKAYFFSAQTFTTVGYGHISPNGFLTSTLAATEALVGLLSFAIATGLFYGRFSKPKAFLKFSEIAVIAPYRGMKAFMIRTAPFKNNNLTDAEVKMTVGMSIEVDGKIENKFYTLDLEMKSISALTLSWTLVHPITENSPFYGFTEADFARAEGEVIVYLKAFDDMFSTTVATGTSYTFDEIVYGARFDMMYFDNEANTKTILHLDKLNSITKVKFEE